jgi:hypothetical protein
MKSCIANVIKENRVKTLNKRYTQTHSLDENGIKKLLIFLNLLGGIEKT